VPEPEDKRGFTERFDRVYTQYAGLYDRVARWLPLYGKWLRQALPHIQGSRVLEVSFGTGLLLTHYAGQYDTYGIDYNWRMVGVARRNLQEAGLSAALQRADVQALPYRDGAFDSVVNTMALSAYPDGHRAVAEMARVVRTGGRLILIDVGYPADRRWLGRLATRFWVALGDVVRDVGALLGECGFDYEHRAIGGLGSVHLYVAEKFGPP
jgi:ubiquinone/menaquinone biosynthesis C-methylase UbiE